MDSRQNTITKKISSQKKNTSREQGVVVNSNANSKKIKIVQYVFTFFLVIFIIVLFFRFVDLEKFVAILGAGIWYYIVIFFILQFLYLLIQPMVFLNLYKIFSRSGSFWQLFNIFLATNFANLALPTAGISGLAIFIGYAEKIGLTRTQALIINSIFYISTFFSFIFIILSILFFPHSWQSINVWEKNVIYVFIFAIIFLTAVSFAAVMNKKFLVDLIKKLLKFINTIYYFFQKREIVSQSKSNHILDEFFILGSALRKNFLMLFKPFVLSFAGHVLHISVLYFIFMAFSSPVSIITAIIGYIISVVFIFVSVTPSGVGIVEPLMILFFVSEGVTLETATLVTFVFRGVVFWLPFVFGFFSLRYIHYYEPKNR